MDGETPGVSAADMGQDTGTMHLFPNPVLTELTYKKKNKKAWLLSVYLPTCGTQGWHAREDSSWPPHTSYLYSFLEINSKG